jgi:hypothetical protein
MPPPRATRRGEDEILRLLAFEVGHNRGQHVGGQSHRAPRRLRLWWAKVEGVVAPALPRSPDPQRRARLGIEVDVPDLQSGQLRIAQPGPDKDGEHVAHIGMGALAQQIELRLGEEDHLLIALPVIKAR